MYKTGLYANGENYKKSKSKANISTLHVAAGTAALSILKVNTYYMGYKNESAFFFFFSGTRGRYRILFFDYKT